MSQFIESADTRFMGEWLPGMRVVLTTGVFDLLHPGHLRLLQGARTLGDVLIVGINSDLSVMELHKGPNRPIVKERDRAQMLAGFRCVDYVTIFNETDPSDLIRRFKPAVYVKGSDYLGRGIPEWTVLHELEIVLAFVPYVAGYSTSDLIRRTR